LKVRRPLAVTAILIFTLVIIAAPLALSQSVMVSYYGYVMSLQLNVTSAPQLLELPSAPGRTPTWPMRPTSGASTRST